MILVIDNYDSFTYNLVQYLGEMGHELRVFRNNRVTLEEIAAEPSLGYTATGESLRRAFERDKKDLRAMGVEIVQTPDGDRPRYRVRPEDLYLSLDLDEEEREEHARIWEQVKNLRRRVASLN